MKIHALGFSFDQDVLPKACSRPDIFQYMSEHCGDKLGSHYQFGATKISLPTPDGVADWWAGLILRIRDAKAYTKLTKIDGKTMLTSEHLGDGEKLAEPNFFIAHPVTGAGLYAYHYQSASISSLKTITDRVFKKCRRQAKNDALAACRGDQKKAAEIRESYQGVLSLSQLCNDDDISTLVKKLKKLNSFEFRFARVITNETLFRGFESKARSRSVKFLFPPDADLDELAEDLPQVEADEELEEIKASGINARNELVTLTSHKNPLVFAAYDYDTVMKDIKLDLSDWSASIRSSPVIERLKLLAAIESIHFQLKRS